jgi:hypothetical protein
VRQVGFYKVFACVVEYTADKISASHSSVQKDNKDITLPSESKALLIIDAIDITLSTQYNIRL